MHLEFGFLSLVDLLSVLLSSTLVLGSGGLLAETFGMALLLLSPFPGGIFWHFWFTPLPSFLNFLRQNQLLNTLFLLPTIYTLIAIYTWELTPGTIYSLRLSFWALNTIYTWGTICSAIHTWSRHTFHQTRHFILLLLSYQDVMRPNSLYDLDFRL